MGELTSKGAATAVVTGQHIARAMSECTVAA
jgi:hypothetical protein